jgi:hypothetical protein
MFLHSDILFQIHFIFVFGNSFFLPTIFLYSRIPCSPVTLLYSEIPLYTFYIFIPIYPRLLAICSALHQHIDDNGRALMSLCRTCVGLIYIFSQI